MLSSFSSFFCHVYMVIWLNCNLTRKANSFLNQQDKQMVLRMHFVWKCWPRRFTAIVEKTLIQYVYSQSDTAI